MRYQEPINAENSVDVLIVGGGIAGCAAAIALARHAPELTVAVCEKSQQSHLDFAERRAKIGETLPPATVIPLQQLGLWEGFRRCQFLPAHGTVAVWGDGQPIHNEYMLSPFGHGWHIDRCKFEAWLQQEAVVSGAQLFYGATVHALRKHSHHWQFLLTNSGSKGELKSAPKASRFVIDASGRRALIASTLGVKKQLEDTLLATFGFVSGANDATADLSNATVNNDPSTYIESSADGWWYSAVLPDQRMVIAVLTDADIAKKKRWSQRRQWLHALAATEHTRGRLAGRRAPPALQRVCAHSQTLQSVAGEDWLAVGDAASCYDPLSSLGMFKALRMSLYAAFAVADTLCKGSSVAAQKYHAVHRQEWLAYLQKRREYYHKEQRFCEHAFWLRRHTSALHLEG